MVERALAEQYIRKSFIEELKTRPLYTIKDAEIANDAHVALSTYYRYYDADKRKLLSSIEQDLMDSFKKALSEAFKPWLNLNHSPSKKDIVAYMNKSLDPLLKYGRENRDELLAISSHNGDPKLASQMLEILSDKISVLINHYFKLYHQENELRNNALYFEFTAYRYSMDIIGTIRFWLKHQDEMTAVECKKMVSDVMMYSSYDFTTHVI